MSLSLLCFAHNILLCYFGIVPDLYVCLGGVDVHHLITVVDLNSDTNNDIQYERRRS